MAKKATFYLDTEFNDFGGKLISIALVGEGGEWYKSLGCQNPTRWVAANVMPNLRTGATTIELLQASLHQFLKGYDAVHIVADWPEDIAHFCNVLITGPGMRIDTPKLTFEIDRDLSSAASTIPHNALHDAKAIAKQATNRT